MVADRAQRVANRAQANARDLEAAETRRLQRAARAQNATSPSTGTRNPPVGDDEEGIMNPPPAPGGGGGPTVPPAAGGAARQVRFALNPDGDSDRELQMILAFKRIGMKQQSAEYLARDQDIDTIDKFMELDEDEIHDLCSVCRKTGKTVTENAKGYAIGILAEANFKRASFYCKYLHMTSRKPSYGDITKVNADSIKDFKKDIEAKDKPEEATPTPQANKAFEFFDSFREYLRKYISTISRRPLAYVVRQDWTVLDSDIDPPFGDPASVYGTYYQEIEARAPIKSIGEDEQAIQMEYDPHFVHDNVAVWEILYAALKGTSYHPYIKPFLSKQDGRAAFQALHDQLLGTQAINTYAAGALNALQSLHLDGTKKNRDWNLDRYVQRHMDQHAILEKLTKYGYQGIGEQQKIHYFLQGITAPELMNVKSSLAVNPKETFQETSTTFKTYATAAAQQTRRTIKQSVHVASVDTRKSGNLSRGKGFKGPSPKSDGYDPTKDYSSHKVKQRYYSKDEWAALTKGQRNYLRQNRKAKPNTKRTLAALTRKIESLEMANNSESKPSKSNKEDNNDDSSNATATDISDDEYERKRPKKKTKVSTKRR